MTADREIESSSYLPSQPTSTSPLERLLYDFESHERQERDFVRKYRELAECSANPSIRYLLDMIASDEEKHHAVTHAMASTLKSAVNWVGEPPPLSGISKASKESAELLKITENYIRVEQDGIDQYKRLARDCKGLYGGLFVLLLSTMIRDSEKHLEILKFLRRTVKGKTAPLSRSGNPDQPQR